MTRMDDLGEEFTIKFCWWFLQCRTQCGWHRGEGPFVIWHLSCSYRRRLWFSCMELRKLVSTDWLVDCVYGRSAGWECERRDLRGGRSGENFVRVVSANGHQQRPPFLLHHRRRYYAQQRQHPWRHRVSSEHQQRLRSGHLLVTWRRRRRQRRRHPGQLERR